ncbi:hypothetical protein [Arenibacter sp. F20364]|uniref:hypothetical protein n=1 Tax=Arenibacter sp. F20364 TaxID=2926415 RepID=UPI001FF32705|nr:hypothetical protein [Arenibacter sp. F20364]MCK0190339.1 hypothetical protein [Arenibacter sp. F20364]
MTKVSSISKYLEGGDLRSTGKVKFLLPLIKSQKDFDDLFAYLYSKDRLMIMRAADALEKITIGNPEYLYRHKKELIGFLQNATHKEFKWHLSLLVSRLTLSPKELKIVLGKLKMWAKDPSESKIVRVNALQALYDLICQEQGMEKEFKALVKELQKEGVPSINARIKKIKNKYLSKDVD